MVEKGCKIRVFLLKDGAKPLRFLQENVLENRLINQYKCHMKQKVLCIMFRQAVMNKDRQPEMKGFLLSDLNQKSLEIARFA